jgi:hypothetical protein
MARLVFAVALLALGLAVVLWCFWPRPRPSQPPNAMRANPVASAEPAPLRFTNEGLAGKMAEEVERIVRPRHAAAALSVRQGGRLACILVEGPGSEKYFELDRGLSAADFAFLEQQGFIPPPAQVSRTMSRYRSVAKMAMNYEDACDHMIVLVCPQEQWNLLQLKLGEAPRNH